MRDRIFAFLLQPDCLSKAQRQSIRAAFDGNDIDQQREVAVTLLEDIRGRDVFLSEDLHTFTPHDSCKVSLIRDVLLSVKSRGQLATQPIEIPAELVTVA